MLHVQVKENESIDRALKRFKKKFDRTRVIRELRKRQAFEKKSVSRRFERMRASYKEKTYGNLDN